jgi:hypothetical protein
LSANPAQIKSGMDVVLDPLRKRHLPTYGDITMKIQLSVATARVLLTTLLFFAAASVCAQTADTDKGFYVGANVGSATYTSRPQVFLGSITLDTTSAHEDDFAWGLTGGYRFGRHFAFEAGYVDLGEGSAHLADFAGGPLQADIRYSVRGATLAGVLLFPVRKWEPFIKLGVLFQDVDLHLNGVQSGAPFEVTSSARGTALFWQAGVNYRFDERWQAGFALTYFLDVGDRGRTGEADLRTAFLGVTYRF